MAKWTRKNYAKLCKGINSDSAGDGLDIETCAHDLAQSALVSEPSLREFIRNVLGAEDVEGRLADDIAYPSNCQG